MDQRYLIDTIIRDMGFPTVPVTPLDEAANDVALMEEKDIDSISESERANTTIEHTLQDHENDI